MTFLGPLGILTHLNWTGSMTLVEAAWDFEPRGTKTFLGPLGILTHLNWTGSMTLVEVAWDFKPGGTMTWPGAGFANLIGEKQWLEAKSMRPFGSVLDPFWAPRVDATCMEFSIMRQNSSGSI